MPSHPAIVLCGALTVCGCAQVEGYIDSKGTVYECAGTNTNGTTIEVCYLDDSADYLSKTWHRECWPVVRWDRPGPTLLGCWYHCDNPDTRTIDEGAGEGCNAHNGCWCPARLEDAEE